MDTKSIVHVFLKHNSYRFELVMFIRSILYSIWIKSYLVLKILKQICHFALLLLVAVNHYLSDAVSGNRSGDVSGNDGGNGDISYDGSRGVDGLDAVM